MAGRAGAWFLAHHDPLTQLTNRSLFNDRLIAVLHAAHRHQSTLALLFLDINDFKQINDIHGHAAGDRCFVRLPGVVSLCPRDGHGGPDGGR